MTLTPGTIDDLRQCVTDQPCALARGAGTKPALSRGTGDIAMIDMTGIRGVLTYDPVEFTISALAGTPLREIDAALAENGQWLPFDPPLTDAGATIGGTVAAGLSGAGRLRFGGLRDFLIGVRFVDGEGELVCGGGSVVKNAAGFDLRQPFGVQGVYMAFDPVVDFDLAEYVAIAPLLAGQFATRG